MVFFIRIQNFIHILQANSGHPDQAPRSAAADLGLDCLLISHKKDALLIWVKVKYHLRDTIHKFIKSIDFF